jgi:hypothetical protein
MRTVDLVTSAELRGNRIKAFILLHSGPYHLLNSLSVGLTLTVWNHCLRITKEIYIY